MTGGSEKQIGVYKIPSLVFLNISRSTGINRLVISRVTYDIIKNDYWFRLLTKYIRKIIDVQRVQ